MGQSNLNFGTQEAGILGMALSASSSYAAYKDASAQHAVDEATRNFNNKEAVKALTLTYRNIEAESDQIKENAISDSIDGQIMAAQAKGQAQAQAGASGTGGSAVDMQIDDIEVATARNTAKSIMNKERQKRQLANNALSAEAQMKSRIDLMPSQKPNKWVYGLQSVSSGFSNVLAFDNLFKAANEL